jgi:hypothetical protein
MFLSYAEAPAEATASRGSIFGLWTPLKWRRRRGEVEKTGVTLHVYT